ncbi:uncharacterized protein N7483_012132 [Penicillium malachiteum]|uniref:uncharacterized protein n=1 Tax=Penicillium malachiteum TaxID=1324776 RepID=UPI0025481A44|nr:uncharacterized protein N7483_012132 [Penicillium malachiteum]KAJ5714951.1 hypothetical protein N7483_012132 [Penicillium malachiteum]
MVELALVLEPSKAYGQVGDEGRTIASWTPRRSIAKAWRPRGIWIFPELFWIIVGVIVFTGNHHIWTFDGWALMGSVTKTTTRGVFFIIIVVRRRFRRIIWLRFWSLFLGRKSSTTWWTTWSTGFWRWRWRRIVRKVRTFIPTGFGRRFRILFNEWRTTSITTRTRGLGRCSPELRMSKILTLIPVEMLQLGNSIQMLKSKGFVDFSAVSKFLGKPVQFLSDGFSQSVSLNAGAEF